MEKRLSEIKRLSAVKKAIDQIFEAEEGIIQEMNGGDILDEAFRTARSATEEERISAKERLLKAFMAMPPKGRTNMLEELGHNVVDIAVETTVKTLLDEKLDTLDRPLDEWATDFLVLEDLLHERLKTLMPTPEQIAALVTDALYQESEPAS